MKMITFSDGGSRGNPGPAAIGSVVMDAHGKVLKEISRAIGVTTNNQAEYQALLAGLTAALELGATEVECKLDSELVVRQLKGEYKVKDAGLAQQFMKVWNLKSKFKKISFMHIRREMNKHADLLVNQALDAKW